MDLPFKIVDDVRSGRLDISKLQENTSKTVNEVEYISEHIPYADFFLHYLLPNKVCVLGPWATENWKSRKCWATKDNIPDLNYLRKHFGGATGPAANCDEEEYSSHPKCDMTVKEFLDYLEEYKERDYSTDMKCLYLKDWHFTRLFPDYEAYRTPEYFASDWLNEFWDSRSDQLDDYRFVYIGPKGSWTPFHSDVLRSYSWSANIAGCKKWWIYPPGEEENMRDRFGQLVYDLRSPQLQDSRKFPQADQSRRRLEVIQRSGEVIFVPSGWHHQVFNLEDTISINHNWLNGCNVHLSWRYLRGCLMEVQREIADCRDVMGEEWHQQCQIVLKASSGINYKEFYDFLQLVADKRLEKCDSKEPRLCQDYSDKRLEKCDSKELRLCQDYSDKRLEKCDSEEPRLCQDYSDKRLEKCDSEEPRLCQDYSDKRLEKCDSEEPRLCQDYSDKRLEKCDSEEPRLCQDYSDKRLEKCDSEEPRLCQDYSEASIESADKTRGGQARGGQARGGQASRQGHNKEDDAKNKNGIPEIDIYARTKPEREEKLAYYDHLTLNHILFDLVQVQTVVKDMIQNEEFKYLSECNFKEPPEHLLRRIENQIKDVL